MLYGEGICGATANDCSWKLYSSGEMIISGNGYMNPDYSDGTQTGQTKAPWKQFREQIKTVKIQEGIKSVSISAFYYYDDNLNVKGYPNIVSIQLPESLETIGNHAFERCSSLKSINIPNKIKTIDHHTFISCTSLQSITIGNNVETIGSASFHSCTSLQTIHWNKSVKTISVNAFQFCSSLKTLSLPDSVTYLDQGCFADCTQLTTVTIPSSVKTIIQLAFTRDSKLTSVTFTGTTEPNCPNSVFSGTPLSVVNVPDGYSSDDFCGITIYV